MDPISPKTTRALGRRELNRHAGNTTVLDPHAARHSTPALTTKEAPICRALGRRDYGIPILAPMANRRNGKNDSSISLILMLYVQCDRTRSVEANLKGYSITSTQRSPDILLRVI